MTAASKLPLPHDYFKCPPLSTEEIVSYKHLAYKNAMDLVRKAQLDSDRYTWTLLSDDHELKFYRGEDLSCPLGYSLHCGTIDIQATMAEISDLFQQSDLTNDQKFNPGTKDYIKLYSIVEPTRQCPRQSLNISWRAIASKFAQVASRDDCVLEASHEFEFNGQKGWVRSMRSIDAPFCPVLEKSHGLVRMKNYCSGKVFLPSSRGPEYIQMIYITHVDMNVSQSEWFGGALSGQNWLTDMVAKWRTKKLSDIDRQLRENRLNRFPPLHKRFYVPVATQTHCNICQKHFGPLSKKTNCVKCGQVVCNKCHDKWPIRVGSLTSLRRVCVECTLTGGISLDDNEKLTIDYDDDEDYLLSPVSTTSGVYSFDMDECMEYLTTNASFRSGNGSFLSTQAEYDPTFTDMIEPIIDVRINQVDGRERDFAFINDAPWESPPCIIRGGAQELMGE